MESKTTGADFKSAPVTISPAARTSLIHYKTGTIPQYGQIGGNDVFPVELKYPIAAFLADGKGLPMWNIVPVGNQSVTNLVNQIIHKTFCWCVFSLYQKMDIKVSFSSATYYRNSMKRGDYVLHRGLCRTYELPRESNK